MISKVAMVNNIANDLISCIQASTIQVKPKAYTSSGIHLGNPVNCHAASTSNRTAVHETNPLLIIVAISMLSCFLLLAFRSWKDKQCNKKCNLHGILANSQATKRAYTERYHSFQDQYAELLPSLYTKSNREESKDRGECVLEVVRVTT